MQHPQGPLPNCPISWNPAGQKQNLGTQEDSVSHSCSSAHRGLGWGTRLGLPLQFLSLWLRSQPDTGVTLWEGKQCWSPALSVITSALQAPICCGNRAGCGSPLAHRGGGSPSRKPFWILTLKMEKGAKKGIVKNVGVIMEVFESIFVFLARGLVLGILPSPHPKGAWVCLCPNPRAFLCLLAP